MEKFKNKIGHKEIQSLEYDILKEFDKFARKNNLQYFLSGGSCLGAIRHQDFIPWDDDIDVCMLREDYDRLLELVKNQRKMGNQNMSFAFRSIEIMFIHL